MPRSVSSLMVPPGAAASLRAIPCPLKLVLGVEPVRARHRARMSADDPPAVLVEYPDVGQKHTILDLAAEIFDAPFGADGADHHLVEHQGILDLHVDADDFPPLDGLQPFVAVHREWPARARADEDEARVDQRAQ